MSIEKLRTRAESELRALLRQWEQAVREKDVERVVSFYAEDIVAYDAILALRFRGVDAYRRHWEKCMSLCPGPMVFEVHELQIVADDQVAFAYGLTRCGSTGADGRESSGWIRMTAGSRRIDDKWKVVHEHFSAPFDMDGGKVLWLEP